MGRDMAKVCSDTCFSSLHHRGWHGSRCGRMFSQESLCSGKGTGKKRIVPCVPWMEEDKSQHSFAVCSVGKRWLPKFWADKAGLSSSSMLPCEDTTLFLASVGRRLSCMKCSARIFPCYMLMGLLQGFLTGFCVCVWFCWVASFILWRLLSSLLSF